MGFTEMAASREPVEVQLRGGGRRVEALQGLRLWDFRGSGFLNMLRVLNV